MPIPPEARCYAIPSSPAISSRCGGNKKPGATFAATRVLCVEVERGARPACTPPVLPYPSWARPADPNPEGTLRSLCRHFAAQTRRYDVIPGSRAHLSLARNRPREEVVVSVSASHPHAPAYRYRYPRGWSSFNVWLPVLICLPGIMGARVHTRSRVEDCASSHTPVAGPRSIGSREPRPTPPLGGRSIYGLSGGAAIRSTSPACTRRGQPSGGQLNASR